MAATPSPGHDRGPESLSRYVAALEETRSDSPALRVSELPAHYLPKVAGYAGGPFLTPDLVTPSEWRWRNTRTVVVTVGGVNYRAVRVFDTKLTPEFVGYWAVEYLGTPLTLPELEK